MKILYCDAYSGIAGDMFLAALLDAGLPLDYLQQELNKLNLPDHFIIDKEETRKGALRALRLVINIHEHQHDHDHEDHHHHHRHLSDILEIINQSSISQQAKKNRLCHLLQIGRSRSSCARRTH